MDADARVRRAGTTRDEGNARPPRQFSERLRHVGGAAFLATHDERQAIARIVERVENGKIALSRNGKRMRRLLGEKIRDEYFAAGAGVSHCVGGRDR